MIAYKGFDKNLRCKGFQYEVGKTYEEPEAKLCECGFHACKYPLDVFTYYPPAISRYCIVELEGVSESNTDDSKCCGKKITIKTEIGIDDLVKAGINYLKNLPGQKSQIFLPTNTGDHSVATNMGDCSVATNTGDWSAATNTGYRSVATNTGDCSAATNTGYCSVATNAGNCSVATNTGNCSAATNTGDWSVATNTGNCSAATNTGDNSVTTNTGNYSVASVSGDESIAIATGCEGKASGAIGCWLVLTDRDDHMHIKNIHAVLVDGKTIKPDVYYTLSDGKVVEVE